MRRKRYLLFPLFFFLFCLPFCAEAQVGEKKLTVEFKNEELSSVFKQLSKISGYKILFTYDDVKSYTYSGAIKDKNIREILYLANLHTSFLCNLIYPTFTLLIVYIN